jgi:hypothetical protein
MATIPPATFNGQHKIPKRATSRLDFDSLLDFINDIIPIFLYLISVILTIGLSTLQSYKNTLHIKSSGSVDPPIKYISPVYLSNIDINTLIIQPPYDDFCEIRMKSWFEKMENDCIIDLSRFIHYDIFIRYKDLRYMMYYCKEVRKFKPLPIGPYKIHRLGCSPTGVNIGIREKTLKLN